MPTRIFKRKPFTKEHKTNISKALKGKPSNALGKHWKLSKEIKRIMGEAHKGEKHWNWKGGKCKSNQDYWLVLAPKHLRANHDGYVKQSILILEKKIGRYLKPNEIAHHINSIRDDDRPENLYLMTWSKHQSYHSYLYWTYKKWGIMCA